MKNAQEYENAAKDVANAANTYSGKQGYNKMIESGIDNAVDLGTAAANEMIEDKYVPTGPGATGAGANANAYNAAVGAGASANQAAKEGFDQGMNIQNARNQALYNANTVAAQQKMKQADIDYQAANQAVQEGMNTVANAANTWNSIRKTSNGRSID